jgi:hypothetical protein
MVHACCAKCGVASGYPAFMGGLSSVPHRLAVPARHAENITNFGADKISAAAKISPFFTELRQPISQLLGVQSKNRKNKKWTGLPPLNNPEPWIRGHHGNPLLPVLGLPKGYDQPWGGRGRRGGGAANVLIRAREDCEQTGLYLPPVLVFTSSYIFSFGLSFAYPQAGCETLSRLIMDRDDPNNWFKT